VLALSGEVSALVTLTGGGGFFVIRLDAKVAEPLLAFFIETLAGAGSPSTIAR
jgi:hypothetical protein